MEQSQYLSDFAYKLNNIFGLQKQGKELVAFVTKYTGCKHACLLFLDCDGEYFTSLTSLPNSNTKHCNSLRISRQNTLVQYLRKDKKLLTRDKLFTLPLVKNLSTQRENTIDLNKIVLLMPLVSRKKVVGILLMGENNSKEYSSKECSLIQSVTSMVAVSMEKEYLREQLNQQKEELSVINRCSVIMASSLDIQLIFDSFVTELRKITDIDWASINLISDGDLYLLALSSGIGSAWKAGERMPVKGSGTEWVANHKKVVVEGDLSQTSRFASAESHIRQGIHSIAYLPLIAGGRALGSLIVASRQANAYSQRQISLLEELTSQIIMPIKNSQLYAEVEEKSRVDGLTGLFNRRSFDEVMSSETSRHIRYGGMFSLIVADIDSLKTINDTYGHLTGDEALRQSGDIIQKVIRNSDKAFRYGGDEFAILLPNTPIDAANRVGERIRRQVAAKMSENGTPVTISLGLASWPANGTDANSVIAAADAALYQAKRSGGNQSQRSGNK